MYKTCKGKSLLNIEEEPFEAYLEVDERIEAFPEISFEGESQYEPTGELEWTEEELDYSIIVSPTSPGDDRFRITARSRRPSSLMFPFNTICFLEIDTGKGIATGSGTLIAPQVVLTARHCLIADDGSPFPKVTVTPGADFSANDPRHQRPAVRGNIVADSTRFRVDPNLDYGVIILPTAFRRPNKFMILQPRSDIRTATLLTIAGYPCDKLRGTMWGHSERIPITGVTDTHLSYTIDTCPGHSGSPIWLLGNAGIRILLGVHTAGPAGCDNDPRPGRQCSRTGAPVTPVAGRNSGVRITCAVIDNIVRWCREFGVRTLPRIDQRVYRRRCTRR